MSPSAKLIRRPRINHYHWTCHQRTPLKFNSLHSGFPEYSCSANLFQDLFWWGWHANTDWVSNRLLVLSPGPLGASARTCPAWQAAGILRIQAVIGWTLTNQSPSLPGGVCCSARRLKYLISLSGQLHPNYPASFQGSQSQLGHSVWGGKEYFSSFHPFWFHRHFSSKLGL